MNARPTPSDREAAADREAALATARRDYLERLRAFAGAAQGAGAGEIVEKQSCRFDGVLLQFALHAATWQIGVYADIGRPEPWQELEACRRLLEMQFHQGTPAIWLVGRHRDSAHLVLATHLAMTDSLHDDVEQLRLLARTCAPIAKGLGNQLLR
jgi:hypothetical protein